MFTSEKIQREPRTTFTEKVCRQNSVLISSKFSSSSDRVKGESGAGFTLLEGIIAITVISIGMIGALALALSNLSSAERNEKRIVAANLAREGIELVRNQRDSNWLKVDLNKDDLNSLPYAWDTFLDTSNQPLESFFIPVAASPLSFSWSKISTPDLDSIAGTCNGQDCIFACGDACRLQYNPLTHTYGVPAVAGTTVTTKFSRLIAMQSICYDDPGNEESIVGLGVSCSGANTKIGVLVTSIVRYDQLKKLDVVVKERLYNWR